MRRTLLSWGMIALLTLPALGQEWSTGFNMGTFTAGGGSEATGYLSFECADASSGFDFAGQPLMTLTPMSGVALNKKTVPDEGITFWIGDEFSYLLPMSVEPGGSSLQYDYSPQSVQSVRDFVAALRKGDGVAALAGEKRLAMISLEGSGEALQYVDDCIAP